MKAVFSFDDYKDLLSDRVREQGAGYKSRLARSIGTPPSFLSQVLHTHVHLSLDHGARLAAFWSLGEDERDYLLGLIQLARAGSRELREIVRGQLAALRKRNEDLSRRYRQPALPTNDEQWTYYTAWHLGAIHMLLTVPGFQKARPIASRLQIPVELVEQGLGALAALGLATAKGEIWSAAKKSIHLDKRSPASPVNHMIWRQRAIQKIYEASERSLHYSGLHTLSRADYERVRALLLDSLDRARKIIEPSKEEELVCLCFDLFAV
ncbi:MAG TPA: DUF4423 domain-containing protein [Bdellovibrionota bacterium]|nr:DUF4423 domain-containing protein [Bdellovibrionota bacterium]